jgi:hypothetical protein
MSGAQVPSRRLAGVTVPLFSLRSARSWGIGEIADLPEFGQWAREAGIRLIQILPLGEISGCTFLLTYRGGQLEVHRPPQLLSFGLRIPA